MESGKEMKNQRMLDELTELMRIDVSSGQETEIAEHLVKKLEQMGFAITRDEAGATFGGVCGNILAVREGERDGVVCFCSHMDRVPGGIGIKPVEEDGILRSSGDTILAADDLSGVAAILEGVRQAIESGRRFRSWRSSLRSARGQSVRCESIRCKPADIKNDVCARLPRTHRPGIVNGAPGRALLEAQVFGKAAHAEMSRRKALMRQKLWRKCYRNDGDGEDWMKIQRRTFLSGPNMRGNERCLRPRNPARGEMRSRSGENSTAMKRISSRTVKSQKSAVRV